MKTLRSVTAGAVATAMLATSAAPAMAQGYGGYGSGRPGYNQGWNGDRYRHRGNDNTGAIVAGVIGVGILAAILASSSKSNRNTANGYDNYGSIRSDNDAADACSSAAERQLGNSARTRSIDTVDAVSGGYNVRGVASTGYGNDDRDVRSFSCTVRQGYVQRVDFGGYAYNY